MLASKVSFIKTMPTNLLLPYFYPAHPSPADPTTGLTRDAGSVLWTQVTLAGEDAADFLHRVTTANVTALAVGRGTTCCCLTPQGKIRAYFTLWRKAVQQFVLEWDAARPEFSEGSLRAVFEDWTFREQLEWGEPPEAPKNSPKALWVFFDQPTLAQWPGGASAWQVGDFQRGWLSWSELEVRVSPELQFLRDPGHTAPRLGCCLWGSAADLQQVLQFLSEGEIARLSLEQLTPDALASARVAATQPWLGQEITQNRNPLEVGLSGLFSSAKGCYPGQEVIEKTLTLGAPARRLVRLAGSLSSAGASPPQAGSELVEVGAGESSSVGELTTVVVVVSAGVDGLHRAGEQGVMGWEGLACVRKNQAKKGVRLAVRGAAAGWSGEVL